MYFVNSITVLTIGIMLISLICLLPFSLYLYEKSCRYFLNNIKHVKYSFQVSFYLNIIKPIIQSTLHTFFYDSPQFQLQMITLISFLTIFISIFMQAKTGLFRMKGIFWSECIIEFMLIILNLLIYLRYYFSKKNQVHELMQFCTKHILSCVICLIIFAPLYEIFRFLLNRIYLMNPKQISLELKKPEKIQTEQKISTVIEKQQKNENRNRNIVVIDRKRINLILKVKKSNSQPMHSNIIQNEIANPSKVKESRFSFNRQPEVLNIKMRKKVKFQFNEVLDI